MPSWVQLHKRELLTILGKGHPPAVIPLHVPVLRAVHDAAGQRTSGPLLITATGRPFTRNSAVARLRRLTHQAGITHPISPHSLRRNFCAAGS